VLNYLVTSPARRRLLTVLWVEHARGSAAELARLAHASFATVFRELRKLLTEAMVVVSFEDGVATYRRNDDHPLAADLRRLLSWRAKPQPTEADDRLRAELAALGAPVQSEAAAAGTRDESVEAVVVRGVELARREPATARALPVLLHRLRGRLDLEALQAAARQAGVGHALGFLLALTARLGHDDTYARAARALRDKRVHAQPFFVTSKHPPVSFPLARRWGFHLGTREADFASTFERFATQPA